MGSDLINLYRRDVYIILDSSERWDSNPRHLAYETKLEPLQSTSLYCTKGKIRTYDPLRVKQVLLNPWATLV